MSVDVSIIDAEGRSRFEARADGGLTGYLDYERGDDTVRYTHTFVSRSSRRQGIGGELVRGAMEDARHRGLKVEPVCGFVKEWIEQHPGYRELVS
ncbi:hypothetical protein GCM10009716_27360 [Streptomyces sodiiphilus]|uniref:N-acetyltransferase n=1 Tax=Streptomyces sodiiphilus TaxID=226217 RepID=A0ABP5AND5_9ACTN